MPVEFLIRVTVDGDDPRIAYDRLTAHIDSPEGPVMAWGSETYSVDGGEPQDTEDLFLGPADETDPEQDEADEVLDEGEAD